MHFSQSRVALAAVLLWMSAAAQAEMYTIPWFVNAGVGGGPQGVLRILNDTEEAGSAEIVAIADTGARIGPVTLTLDALTAVELSATELESGNADKGLENGLGSLDRDVRLLIDSDVAIVPSAYVRSGDGTLAALHDTVLEARDAGTDTYLYDVAIFHPAANAEQQSLLRLINPGEEAALIMIGTRDDAGMPASGGTVELTLPGGAARTLTAQQLEAGDNAELSGQLGAGVGNWRLSVVADRPIQALHVTAGTGGGWSNLSTTAISGWAPADEAAFESRFRDRVIVSRDGQDRLELAVLAEGRFRGTGLTGGVRASDEGDYGFERIGRDAGLLMLAYDSGLRCTASLYFDSPTSGRNASGCVDAADAVQAWGVGSWWTLEAGAAPLDLGPAPEDMTYGLDAAIDALTLPAASGGDGEFTYSLSPGVPGLSFDPATRELTGTPSEEGTWSMTYRVRDASGDSDWRYFNITVGTDTGGGEMTHGVGDTLSDLPAGSWTPDVTSGGSFSSSGGNTTINLNEGGYIEEGDYRFTCQSSGGCTIENRRVTLGTIVQAASGTGTDDGETGTDDGETGTDDGETGTDDGETGTDGGGAIGNFDLHDDVARPAGIVHANGRFHIVDGFNEEVYAYTGTGERDASADFDLHEDNTDAHGMAHANGRFYVVDGFDQKAYAYTGTGERDASSDFDLHEDNGSPSGIAHANGRFYVVDGRDGKVFAYTESGARDASVEFDLHEDNGTPRGIAHANGRFYVVDFFEEKAFAYTGTGDHDASSDFDLHDDNLVPGGIAHANGRLYVVDWSGTVHEYGGTDPGAQPSFAAGSGPGDQTYIVGTAIGALTLPAAGGGVGPLTYSLSPAVPGLSFNATTRRLTGTPTTAGAPTAAGTFDMTYRVRNIDGDMDSLTFTITVEE